MVTVDPDEPWKRPPLGTWVHDAACVGTPQEWWFPLSNSPDELTPEAEALCAACPVQPDCLEHAVRTGEDDGIWGGRTPRQRARLRRATRRSITA